MLAKIPVTDSNGGRLYVDADAILFAAADLFASRPHLAQHLVNLALNHKARGEGFPFFLNLFEVASGPTAGSGAEDYRFGYRLRTAEQCESAKWTRTNDEVSLDSHEIAPPADSSSFGPSNLPQ
jgi:hypothetical protein